ncbi:hypothetical protein F4820DRAFT_452802 [Hypoxylon rubiginosum]|uniref:Uncharacterized protein n=1 Tax=Hypoxylon rubiginosum TaxID=110542 RepID=A0ACB9YML3_9PEZI|nr:hypothetical protein F4820DRAFT_452802 [Hypoxylon rubiginosum]
MPADPRRQSASVRGDEPDTRQALREWQESQQSPNRPAWNTAKFALRITSTVLAVTLFVVSIAGFAAPRGFGSILGAPLAAAAIVFDMAGLIVVCVRKRKSGMRPTVSLGFELMITLAGIALSTLLVFSAVDSVWSLHYYTADRNGYFRIGMSVAVSILAVFLTLVHFVLFILDCVEVDRQRRATKRFLEKVASIDVVSRRESTIDRPAPSYSMAKRESRPQSSRYDNVRPF